MMLELAAGELFAAAASGGSRGDIIITLLCLPFGVAFFVWGFWLLHWEFSHYEFTLKHKEPPK